MPDIGTEDIELCQDTGYIAGRTIDRIFQSKSFIRLRIDYRADRGILGRCVHR